MRKPVVLITGASGEIGHGLITRLRDDQEHAVITLDLKPLPAGLEQQVQQHFVGSILDAHLLDRILVEHEIDLIFHLAAMLSTRSELAPLTAHRVNVEGTMSILEFAQRQAESHGRKVVIAYPSSIAAYGLPGLETKAKAGKVHELDYVHPTTMYGCNKLYCEQMGRYYAKFYKQLSAEKQSGKIDFRSLRFPGLISAMTIPSGGTSDYASEMIHAAAQGKSYACFVRPETRIPFMVMPDAIDSLLKLATVDAERLTRTVYNVGAFNPSAGEIAGIVKAAFPHVKIDTTVDKKRQGIVDTWPEDVDDSAARNDWKHEPEYDLERGFQEYLIPTITDLYR